MQNSSRKSQVAQSHPHLLCHTRTHTSIGVYPSLGRQAPCSRPCERVRFLPSSHVFGWTQHQKHWIDHDLGVAFPRMMHWYFLTSLQTMETGLAHWVWDYSLAFATLLLVAADHATQLHNWYSHFQAGIQSSCIGEYSAKLRLSHNDDKTTDLRTDNFASKNVMKEVSEKSSC
jgi:hypothetical protein